MKTSTEQVVDVFEIYDKFKTQEERIVYLKKKMIEFPSIRVLMQYAYDDRIKIRFDVCPKHRREKFQRGLGYKSFHKWFKLLEHFTVQSKIPEKRAKAVLEGLLGDLQYEDADIVEAALFKRKLPYKNLSKKFVKENFPELFK